MAKEWQSYFPTYHLHLLADKELGRCPPEAWGVLLAAMCLSADGEPFGSIGGEEGEAPSAVLECFAGAVVHGRTTAEVVASAWSWLVRERRVIWDEALGAWTVPKMLRIGTRSAFFRECGRRGGNPALRAPEAKGEDKEPDGEDAPGEEAPAPPPAEAPQAPAVDWDDIVVRWNAVAEPAGFGTIKAMAPRRKLKWRARMKEEPRLMEVIEEELPRTGAFATRWLTLDWLLASADSWTKFAEGRYRDRPDAGAPGAAAKQEPPRRKPTEVYDAALEEMVLEAEKRPEAELGGFWRTAWDKYRDVPRIPGRKPVVSEAQDVAAYRRECKAKAASKEGAGR